MEAIIASVITGALALAGTVITSLVNNSFTKEALREDEILDYLREMK